MMRAEERGGAGQGWGLALATSIAITTGVHAALALARREFLTGGALLLVSVAVLRWPLSIWRPGSAGSLAPRQRRMALLAACALAVFFRIYRLEPPGLWGDEAVNGLRAFDILDGKVHSPFELVEQPLTYFHALSNYPIAAAFWAFGAGPVTLRLPGIVAGILAVPLLYATGAPLFGSDVALVAAAFFASSPWQISHAKGVTQIEFGEFFLLLGLCAVVRGAVGRRRWLIPMAGVPIATCLYTYHAAKLAPVVPIIFLLAVLLRGPERRKLVLSAAGFLAVLSLCSIPAVRSYMEHPGALTERVSGVALWPFLRTGHGLGLLWDSIWRTLMIFQYQQGPIYHWFGIGTDPALNLLLAFLFVHGLVESLRHGTASRHILLLGWFAVGLIPGFLSTEAPRAYRILLASPVVYMWAALPVAHLYRHAAPATSGGRWVRGGLVLLLLAVPLIDFNYYFYRVYTHRDFRWYQAARMVEMAHALKARGSGWRGALLADGFAANYETLSFLSRAWGLSMQDVSSLADVLPVQDGPEGGVLFMMDRTTIGASTLMQSLYPSVELDVRNEPHWRTWWLEGWLTPSDEATPVSSAFFPVSRRAAADRRGVSVSFFGANGDPVVTRVDTQLAVQESSEVPSGSPAPLEARWSGAVLAPTAGIYGFALQAAGGARVWIDGWQLVSNDAPETSVDLPQGLHRLAATANVSEQPALLLQWRPPGTDMQPIPARLLFRDADVHGLLAEYVGGGQSLRRIEPYPYYTFFPDTVPGPFTVQWRGRLRIPSPGGYRLELISNGQRQVAIDGHPWQPAQELAAGVHAFSMRIADVQGAAHLQLYWAPPNASRVLIPPEAFAPP